MSKHKPAIKSIHVKGVKWPYKIPKETMKNTEYLDLATVEKCSDPLPKNRLLPESKYKKLFATLKVGDCLKVQSDKTGTLANSLRTWSNGQHQIKSVTNYGDGMGRVWLLAKALK